VRRRLTRSTASLATSVGDVPLRDAIMLASGTAGHGAELAGYGDLSELGAVVTKSLAAFAWEGNRAPRVAPAGVSMINAVGLAGPGVTEWLTHGYQSLLAEKATVVASIWGRTVEEFALAAEALKGIPVAAVEINASCPNLEARNAIFANSPDATAEVVAATASLTVPRWVKLTTTAPGLLEVVAAAVGAGASAVTLGNTLTGLVIDVESRRPILGNGGGGVSGEAARPVALRAVFDVRAQYSTLPIIGVGGVSTSKDALAMFMAGADAVQVGTATFADPRAPWKISRGCRRWLDRHGFDTLSAIKGAAHG
jgi:dihydroorotate dehydrogenase (NAD+) catalytic subunit